jgi:hypothetical protein
MLAMGITAENQLPLIAAVDNIVKRARLFYSRFDAVVSLYAKGLSSAIRKPRGFCFAGSLPLRC